MKKSVIIEPLDRPFLCKTLNIDIKYLVIFCDHKHLKVKKKNILFQCEEKYYLGKWIKPNKIICDTNYGKAEMY